MLTATFNRAHTLRRVFESLQRQTVDGFEWCVVDDGSTDNTPELLSALQHQARFPMTWCRYSNNRGRNAAVNTGFELVRGKYIITLDSDDELFDNAIETINHWRLKSGIDSNDYISELRFHYVYAHDQNIIENHHYKKNKRIGGGGSDNLIKRYSKKCFYRLKMRFDMLSVQKTSICKTYNFTELNCSEHCSEGITHNQVRNVYDFYLVNVVIGKVYRHEKDGETHLAYGYKLLKWPRGNYLGVLAVLNNDIECLKENPSHFIKCAQKITGLGLLVGRSFIQQYNDLTNGTARILWMMTIWYGLLSYVRYRLGGANVTLAHPNISAWGPANRPKNLELHSAFGLEKKDTLTKTQ